MSPASSSNIAFEHLTGSPEFEQFTSILKRLTGLVMALNSPGVGIIQHTFTEQEQSPLCQLIRGDPEGLRRCNACDRRHHSQAVNSGKARLYTCHAGFLDIAVPIFVFGRHVATISSGQLLAEPKSAGEFRRVSRRLAWLGIPDRQLRQAYDNAPYLPREQIKSVMRLLELFARQLCESGQRIRDLQAQLERVEVRRAREFVELQFRDPALCLRETARHACLSPAHFSHVFRQTTGVGFTRFVQTRRITEAKRLLTQSQQSITEICFACGFSSLTHFNRVFRQFESRSPRQYRQESCQKSA